MVENTEELHALIGRDDELAGSLAVVLDVAESGDGTVAWSDVNADIADA
ncbi:hypothetical protein [Halococcus saccharolyticus]|nr:hypothetical protein [Halococcus saccharolyticus]